MSNLDHTPNQQIYQKLANIQSQVSTINEYPAETPNTILMLNSIIMDACEIAKHILSKPSYDQFISQQKANVDSLLNDIILDDEIINPEPYDDESFDEDDTMYDVFDDDFDIDDDEDS